MIFLSGISRDKYLCELTKEEREKIISLLKHFSFTIVAARGYNEAIITQGGVDVKQVDPSTMESKLVPGVYFAGEVLDLDAMTELYFSVFEGDEDTELGLNGSCAADDASKALLEDAYNVQVTEAGTYTFTVDLNTFTFTVEK